MVNSRPKHGPSTSAKGAIPTVEDEVARSTDAWARDLQGLFEHAKDRFGDVSWESEEGGDRVWAHKAVIYARAPKAFKDRYFFASSRSANHSPSLRTPSPSGHLLPPTFPGRPFSPPSAFRDPYGRPDRNGGSSSSSSFRSASTDFTVRPSTDGVLRLTHGDTPELFRAQLEWLYTGEGFGDVVEWISDDESPSRASIRDSLGRRGNQADRRDKLGQDLTYMWRSKLYVDVRIHLSTALSEEAESSSSEDSNDSLSSTAVFTAHRFILISRSPYFASLLLNPSSFLSPPISGGAADVHLPTPPFTPASLHFCLGYMYAGHLDFSNRSFDLGTAFQIYRAAEYLQLDTLVAEVTARIVWDFCHGLQWDKMHCRKCAVRMARVWKFAIDEDIGAVELGRTARKCVTSLWGDAWGREVATLQENEKVKLVNEVATGITRRNIVATFKAISTIRARIDAAVRSKGREAVWVESLEEMLHTLADRMRVVLVDDFASIAEGPELWDLLHGKGFSDDLLEGVMGELVDAVGTSKGCVEGPRVYQALVSSILLKTDSDTMQPVLPARSSGRQQIEGAKEGVLARIRKRWMQIRDAGGFIGLETWALKEIADEIEVSDEDLVVLSLSPPKSVARRTPLPTRAGIPRTTSRIASLADASSSRSMSIASSSRIPLSPASRIPTANTNIPSTEPSGLRRLRLSSSASTSSSVSARSARPRESSPLAGPLTGPQARSPTAAKPGNRVSIGPASRKAVSAGVSPSSKLRNRNSEADAIREEQSASPTPSPKRPAVREPMRGGIRPLVSRGSLAGSSAVQRDRPAATPTARGASPTPTPSLASVRTTRTARSTATINKPVIRSDGSPVSPSIKKPLTQQSQAGGTAEPKTTGSHPNVIAMTHTKSVSATRSRQGSASTTASTSIAPAARARQVSAASTNSKAPSVATTIARTPASQLPRSGLGSKPIPPDTTRAGSGRPPAGPSRDRTISAATTASVQSKSPSVISARSKQTVLSTLPAGRATMTRVDAAPFSPPKLSGIPRPSGLSPKKGAKPASSANASKPTAISASSRSNPPTVMPTLFPSTNRSASSSTADEPHARTPRSSETSDPIIVRPSDPSYSSTSRPASPSSASASAALKLPPVSLTRPTRKVSSSSTHSAASAFRSHPASAFDPPRRSEPVSVPLKEREITDGSMPFTGRGVSLRVGIPCIVSLEGKRAKFRAQVKYIGYRKDAKGAWVGLETENLDRLNVPTLPSGSVLGTHYFHLTEPPAVTDEVQVQAESAIRSARQRKIEMIREGLKRSSMRGLGLGLGSGMGRSAGIPAGGLVGGLSPLLPLPPSGMGIMGAEMKDGRGRPPRRSTSPSPFMAGRPGEWLAASGADGEGLRALFVRPSEVVYVLDAE